MNSPEPTEPAQGFLYRASVEVIAQIVIVVGLVLLAGLLTVIIAIGALMLLVVVDLILTGQTNISADCQSADFRWLFKTFLAIFLLRWLWVTTRTALRAFNSNKP